MSEQWWAVAVGDNGVLPRGVARWIEAVDLGARGRASAARVVLADLVRDRHADRALVSLALSTRASLTRQAGKHADARVDDGAALLAVSGRSSTDPWVLAARVDALVGLAADSLGIWDFDGSLRLLDRAGSELDAAELDSAPAAGGSGWACEGRIRLRLAWVRTELALYSGDPAAATLAARAVELAIDAPSDRHRLKTELIAAAADPEDAAVEAERIADACGVAGLIPLEWAARTMLAGLRPERVDAASTAAALQQALIDWGMPFEPLAGRGSQGSVRLIND